MAIVELGNVFSRVTEASTQAIRAIDSALAVPTPGYNFTAAYKSGKWDGMTRFYRLTSGKFPSGLLSRVLQALKIAGEPVELIDKRGKIGHTVPDKIELTHSKMGKITLRDYQYAAVKDGLTTTRGIVNVATNGGKTEIACGMIKCVRPHLKDGQRIAFFTHAKEIFYQSHKRIEERLGIKVGLIGDGVWDEQQVTVVMIPTVGKYLDIPKILPKNAKRTKIEKDIATHKKDAEKVKQLRETLMQLEKQEWEDIKAKVKKTKAYLSSVVAFIADEVHHASSSTWYDLFLKLENAYYRFGLTGTVDDTDPIGVNRLMGSTGKIVAKITNEFLISEGYSAKPTVYMIPIDCDTVYGDYADSHADGIIWNDTRNNAFVDIIVERANSGNQCLIILNETEHGNIIQGMLLDSGIDAVFSHGKKSSSFRKEALEGFSSGDIRVLIATPILDEGVDVSGINCLFLMGGGKSMRQLLQRIGRGLRLKADGSGVEVYDALDYHNEYLAQHTLERYETYKGEGFEIVKL